MTRPEQDLRQEDVGSSRAARLELPERDAMSPEQQAVYDEVIAGPRGKMVGPLRAVIHSPELAVRWSRLGEFLRYKTRIPPRQSELAILVTGRRWTSQLEWGVHSRIAADSGVPEPVIAAIRDGAVPEFTNPDDRMVYEFVRQLQQSGRIEKSAYLGVQERWSDAGVVELVAIVGYYTMVAMTLNAHEIPLPDGLTAELCIPEEQSLFMIPRARKV